MWRVELHFSFTSSSSAKTQGVTVWKDFPLTTDALAFVKVIKSHGINYSIFDVQSKRVEIEDLETFLEKSRQS